MEENMKELLIDARSPIGSRSLLENEMVEIVRGYLASKDKKCLTPDYKGMPMDLSEVKDLLDANYILEINLRERS
jgi:hypothetical protein